MFYDFELGEAFYETSNAKIEGTIGPKRQFRIRKGEMEYMLDSDITIQDDVLQKELNQASTAKMKNIVANIQREQNAIIRNEDARHLIIQGVPGSGKTSIALHRIASLLYLENEGFKPGDIMVGRKPVPAWFLTEEFQKHSRKPILNRFNEVVREIVTNVFIQYRCEIMGKVRTQLHITIRKMFPSTNLRMLFKEFYN